MPERTLKFATLFLVCSFCVVLLTAFGCSKGNPIEPTSLKSSESPAGLDKGHGNPVGRALIGYWQVSISDDKTVEIVPQRATAMHLNVLKLLENGGCTDCLMINDITFLPDNIFSALVVVQHPFPGLKEYMAFDVRGIFISGGVYNFPSSGKKMAWGDNVPRMISYDGYTNIFNPTEFPKTTPPALGYIPGNRATGGDISSTMNPYVAFERDYPRSKLDAGGPAWKYVQVHAKTHPIQFGYAIDACWQIPLKDADGHYLEDDKQNYIYPPDANCLEAYKIDPYVGDGITAGGGSASIQAIIFDHQGLSTIVKATVEAPDLFSGIVNLSYSSTNLDGSFVYTGIISNDKHVGYGEYPILIRVVDSQTDQNLGAIDAWQVYDLQVKRGWARVWGGTMADIAYAVAVGPGDKVYVAGLYYGSVDFDPGPGIDQHTSVTGPVFHGYTADIHFSCFDSSGVFQWARVLSDFEPEKTCDGSDTCFDIATDTAGNVYITGWFQRAVDFDPGPGTDKHAAVGGSDAYVGKYDSSGNLLWARTWGGTDTDAGYAVAVDSAGSVYVTGTYLTTVDFDPSPGSDSHTSNGSTDVFLSKFDSSGTFQWAKTWGGTGLDSASSVVVDTTGRIYVSGSFRGTLDFDPGAGTDSRASVGGQDAFLSMFNQSGTYTGAYTWGGTSDDHGDEAAVDTANNVYTVGTFSIYADLDPTAGTNLHFSAGLVDAYIIKIGSTGAFQWAKSWGGVSTDYPLSIGMDGSNNAFVSGRFYETADFDPGAGTDNHTSHGLNDAFLSKFDSSGNFQWARTWGGLGEDYATGVAADSLGNAFVGGYFEDVVDFDAGSGFDMLTSLGDTDMFLCKYPPDGVW